MVSFFAEGGVIRGGISTVGELKYANSNDFNIRYYDVTNLYGYAMTFPLPYGGFVYHEFKNSNSDINSEHINNETDRFKSHVCDVYGKKYKKMDIIEIVYMICSVYSTNTSSDESIGYIFEVDIEYPPNLHAKHNPLPFLAEHLNGKLIPNLKDKLNYRLHIITLIQAINNGLRITRIHKIIYFNQKPWLKGYVMHNTIKRSQTNDKNLKNFYKLMNNAVYGKTMENILNRSNLKIYSMKEFSELMKNKSFSIKIKSAINLTKSLVVVNEKSPISPVYDKPVYIGFSILEISKYHMYNLYYNVLTPKFDRLKLMYMDTDSFIVAIPKNTNFNYKDIENYFDLSVYPSNSIHYIAKNKGILGTLKDEYANGIINEIICLKSKCYALRVNDGVNAEIVIKNKGVSSTSNISFSDFEYILENPSEIVERDQYSFRSFNHELYTVMLIKNCLGGEDDKREMISKFETRPLFSKI